MKEVKRIRAGGIPLAGVLAGGFFLLMAAPAEAYIGPGAGFAILSSFFVVFVSALAGLLALLFWPVRFVSRAIRGRRAFKRSRIKRLVILGLDGMEPTIIERLIREGKLPNMAKLQAQGSYGRLGTTTPPLSPVAWSSFQTGVNPGKHNIFDFLDRNKRTYEPVLSSVRIRSSRRNLKVGKYLIPLGKPELTLLRKSKPFWKILGDHGIFSSIIRVPITWPPEKFRGISLSAMCVPDLRGSQGTFTYYTSRRDDHEERTGGTRVEVDCVDGRVKSQLIGPDNSLKPGSGPMLTPFVIELQAEADRAKLAINGETYKLERGRYTDWITVPFKAGLGVKVNGICRFLLVQTQPHFLLYVTPIQIDPEKPVMPIAYPRVYSNYLAKKYGQFATLGLAEDTWALSEEVIDDDAYLEQCLWTDRERESQFFDALANVKRGCVVCVFDSPDRVQHMFWRHTESDHPAHPSRHGQSSNGHAKTIEEMYLRMDAIVGKTMKKVLRRGTLLMVISDHGFNSFRRGIDLNRWLIDHGYMKLKAGEPQDRYLKGVDWANTKAYALGLAGIFINQKGREAEGIVASGTEARQVKDEIIAGLTGLKDPETGQEAIRRVMDAEAAYKGPYQKAAPDLVIGYHRGYRVGWDTAIGKVTHHLFADNVKAWSGDHCIDPELIPGVMFSSMKVTSENPHLMDLAATALNMFGVDVPAYMDGKPLKFAESTGK